MVDHQAVQPQQEVDRAAADEVPVRAVHRPGHQEPGNAEGEVHEIVQNGHREDTEEHREIFGDEGEAVLYFRNIREMVEKVDWLLRHGDERYRLKQSASTLVVTRFNTYRDRLMSMLGLSCSASQSELKIAKR